MMKIALFLAALLVFTGFASSQGVSGVDISGFDLTMVAAPSAVACAQLCDGRRDCLAWAWDSCGKSNCWLKANTVGYVINTCRSSGVRLGDAGFDRPGYDMPGSPINLGSGATASTCAYRCVNTTGCVAWSWTGYCWLKSWASAPVVSSGATSGVQGTTGLDWSGVPDLATITLSVNASSTDCAKRCESTSGCAAWSINTAGAACPTSGVNTCHLKSYVSSGGGLTGAPLVACRSGGLASRFFDSTLPGGAAVNVASVVTQGNQTDPHLAPVYPNRDGGAIGTVGGKIVWVWSDTTYVRNGQFAGFYGNTEAIGTPGNPLLMNGPQRQAIPFTSQEQSFNTQYNNNPRVVLWPKSGVIETTPGLGYLWVPKGYWGATISAPEPNQGIELSTVTIGTDGYPLITRLSDVPIFPSSAPGYGAMAAARDQNYVYLYSIDRVATYTTATYLARAPLTSPSTLSSYRYYNAATGSWDVTAPNPTSTDTSKAIFTTAFGIDANVFYSSYHRKWILIFQYHGEKDVMMRTASAPQGPWSADTRLFTAPTPNPTYIYGTTGTNLYDANGKTASVDFTWTQPSGYTNWVLKVTFA